MTKMFSSITVAILCAVSASATAQTESTITGEVVQIQQQERTQNGGDDVYLRVRTRQNREVQVRLRQNQECSNCVRVGDRIRARVQRSGDQRSGTVQSLKVRRNGSQFHYRFQSGHSIRTRSRSQLQDGTGIGLQNQHRRQRGRSESGTRRGIGGGG